MITILTLLPIVGGFAVLALASWRSLARAVGMVFAVGALAVALLFWFGLNRATPGMQFEAVSYTHLTLPTILLV